MTSVAVPLAVLIGPCALMEAWAEEIRAVLVTRAALRHVQKSGEQLPFPGVQQLRALIAVVDIEAIVSYPDTPLGGIPEEAEIIVVCTPLKPLNPAEYRKVLDATLLIHKECMLWIEPLYRSAGRACLDALVDEAFRHRMGGGEIA